MFVAYSNNVLKDQIQSRPDTVEIMEISKGRNSIGKVQVHTTVHILESDSITICYDKGVNCR